jgi:quercetin dioxygenase-like cupin family protein
LTLDDISTAASLSKAHLSRFERGEKSLSIAALLRLTESLDTTMAILLGEDQPKDSIRIVRQAERRQLTAEREDGGLIMQSLNGTLSERPNYTAFVVRCPEGIEHSSEAFHSGCELIYVIEGTLKISLPGRDLVLDRGDFVEFPGHMKHVLHAAAGGAELLLLVLPG